jgi:hypothetical protein
LARSGSGVAHPPDEQLTEMLSRQMLAKPPTSTGRRWTSAADQWDDKLNYWHKDKVKSTARVGKAHAGWSVRNGNACLKSGSHLPLII